MTTPWTPAQLQAIDGTDDFHIAPYRADGTTPGTLTWIWSVVVDDAIYVRAYLPSMIAERTQEATVRVDPR